MRLTTTQHTGYFMAGVTPTQWRAKVQFVDSINDFKHILKNISMFETYLEHLDVC